MSLRRSLPEPRSFLVCLALMAGLSSRAFALDPTKPFSSYLRTHFTNEEGFNPIIVNVITQTSDGFLWLGVAGHNLVRFDGRHFSSFPSPRGTVLANAPAGDLWLGGDDGLERIPSASFNQFGQLPTAAYHPGSGPRSHVTCLHFSPGGAFWVGTAGGLFRFERGGFSPIIAGISVERIEDGSNGRLLVSTSEGFLEWDGSRALTHPELAAQLGVNPKEIFHVLEDSRGVTWFCTGNGVARRVGGSLEKLPPYGSKKNAAYRVYEDPQKNVWIIGDAGLFRATTAGVELVAPGMNVRALYADRDGNLWIGTNGDGLYRYKDRPIRMFTTADGLPTNVIMTALIAHDGKLWTGANCGGISWFDGQRFHPLGQNDGLLNTCVWSLAEDVNRDLWIGTYGGGVFRYRNGRFTQYSKAQGLAGDIVGSIVPAQDAGVWIGTPSGVSHIRDGVVRTYTVADGLSTNITMLLSRDRSGGLWVGNRNGIDRLTGDRFVNVLSVSGGAALVGQDRSGAFYVTFYRSGGLARLENGRIFSITRDAVTGDMEETAQGDLWIIGDKITRFPPGSLQRKRAPDDPVDMVEFGRADGLAAPGASAGIPDSALTRDGKLWLATPQGLALLDLPRMLSVDRKPTLYMEEITVGRKRQPPGHELSLPPGTHHVELPFDAIEISSPERIRLQYRLDGVDTEWLDADFPAHATYSNIPPGSHAFHMRARNRDGIWDRLGTVYNITQQPFFYETLWFQFAAAASGIVLMVGFVRLRVRTATVRLNSLLEARLRERERIARDLHDTLLQSFQGLVLRFQAVDDLLPAGKAKAKLEEGLLRADQAISEGRIAVFDLRSSTWTTNDLARALRGLGDEFTTGDVPAFQLGVEGAVRDLHPIIRDETYRIAREALNNAFRHAGAHRIETEIAYGDRAFHLRIRDDGKGIPSEIVEQGRSGHYGLLGMRERAHQFGGKLEIWSKSGAGTEIELTIAGSIAYRTARGSGFWGLFRRKGDHA